MAEPFLTVIQLFLRVFTVAIRPSLQVFTIAIRPSLQPLRTVANFVVSGNRALTLVRVPAPSPVSVQVESIEALPPVVETVSAAEAVLAEVAASVVEEECAEAADAIE